jgi:formylglycine-generating enzyme required for sulfatase activity
MVQIGALCIDAYEATVTGELGNADQGEAWPDGSTTATTRAVAGVLPTTNLTWYQAVAACENSGRHLCTVTEWQAACGAGPFPWGDEPLAEDVCALPAADGTTTWDALQPTGSLPDCVSPAGVYDQLGNAWEWADPETSGEDGLPVTAKMGGAYYAGNGSALCFAAANTEHPPTFEGTISARCCVEARDAD